MTCVVCKKDTEGTMGPSHTRVPVCSGCTSDKRQRTLPGKTPFVQRVNETCPDCKGWKGWKSKRCASCATKATKKDKSALFVCPRCQGPKMKKSFICRNCFNNERRAPDPLENSKEDQEKKP